MRSLQSRASRGEWAGFWGSGWDYLRASEPTSLCMDRETNLRSPSAAWTKSSGWPGKGRYCSTRNLLTRKCLRQGLKSGQAESGRQQRQLALLSRGWSTEPLVGLAAQGRAGLGTSTPTRYDKAQGKARRLLIQEQVRASAEEERASRAVAMQKQGAWTRWKPAVERKVSWAELWKASLHQIPHPGCLRCTTKPI